MKYINRYLRITIQQPVQDYGTLVFDDSWKITFDIHKAASSNYLSFNTAEISIYNLSSEYRTLLAQRDMTISIDAGYVEKHGIVFDGIINNVTHVKNGVDIVTTLYCSSNIRKYNSPVNLSVKNIKVTDLLTQICEQAGVAYELPFTRSEVVTRSYTGTLAKVVAEICYDYNISAGIDNGVLIFKDKLADQNKIPAYSVYTFTPNTGIIGNPTVNERGVSFRAFVNPDLQVNSYFDLYAPYTNYNLNSLTQRPNAVLGGELNAMAFIDTHNYNGLYMALSINLIGDTRGNSWYIDVEGSRVWDRSAHG